MGGTDKHLSHLSFRESRLKSSISARLPTERDALRRLASRRRTVGERESCFRSLPKPSDNFGGDIYMFSHSATLEAVVCERDIKFTCRYTRRENLTQKLILSGLSAENSRYLFFSLHARNIRRHSRPNSRPRPWQHAQRCTAQMTILQV